MLPRTDDPDPEIVFLNTAGGVTGGDRLDYALHLGPRTRATGAMQTAERAYRSTGAAGKVDVSLRVGPGGHLDWLPQETILFEGCRLERETVVDLEGDATVLMADMVVLGRAAMGEVPACARLEDRRTVRRDGRLVHREHLSVAPQALADVHALAGTRALATLVLVSPGAADCLEALRGRLAGLRRRVGLGFPIGGALRAWRFGGVAPRPHPRHRRAAGQAGCRASGKRRRRHEPHPARARQASGQRRRHGRPVAPAARRQAEPSRGHRPRHGFRRRRREGRPLGRRPSCRRARMS